MKSTQCVQNRMPVEWDLLIISFEELPNLLKPFALFLYPHNSI